MSDRIYSIYKITNQINQKVYIGQTSNLKGRIAQHFSINSPCRRLKNSIKKYGRENFKVDVIETCQTIDECNRKEIHWIIFYDSMNSDKGYNLKSGGDNKFHSTETIQKMKNTRSTLIHHFQGKCGESHPRYGKKNSTEHRSRISNSLRGKKLTESHKKAMSLGHIGQVAWNKMKIQCVETKEIYNSIKEAEQKLKICNVSLVLNKKRNHAGGLTFIRIL